MLKASGKTKPRPRKAKAGPNKRNTRDLFWRRVFHPELDRAGDFILKNLDGMRKEAVARGDSRLCL